MSAREQVEAYWERVLLCDGSYREYPRDTVLINWANHCFYDFPTWSAALAFTEEHKRKAAELGEQIVDIGDDFAMYGEGPDYAGKQRFVASYGRTLAMLESALAQHMIGVKGVTR